MPSIANHTRGLVRYITVICEFPDKTFRVYQTPFVNELSERLKLTKWYKYEPWIIQDIARTGEAKFRDGNGVKTWIKIEKEERPDAKQI